MQKDTFKEKVLSMTAKEIIMSMVEGLQNPVITINMDTYGEAIEGVCFGCAATNAVCKISGKVFTEDNIDEDLRSNFLKTDRLFLSEFEMAIDNLRAGGIKSYNFYANEIGIAQIKKNIGIKIPECGLHPGNGTQQRPFCKKIANTAGAVNNIAHPDKNEGHNNFCKICHSQLLVF